jgi:hypothetical protein
MINRNLLAIICLFVVSTVVCAQTTGSIRGMVTDIDNKPLPGATITISSNALIGQKRITYTNELGVYRFPSLSPGSYSVEATMEGLETVQIPNVEVSLQFTAVVPIQMKIEMKTEAVNVVGETPLVDVTDSGFSTSYNNELLQEVPTQRNMTDLMQLAPGMSPGIGDSFIDRTVAFGSNVQSNAWIIDGLDASGPETGNVQWSVTPDLIQEIQVIGIGAPAEYGNHLGAVFNVVTKKGGNQLHGGASYYYQDDSLTGTNVELDPNFYPCGTDCNTFHRIKYNNFSSHFGGPILKEKLSFFSGFEYRREARTNPGEDPATAHSSKSDKYDLKLTGTLGEKQEITGFFHYEDWGYPWPPSLYYEPSALPDEGGSNPAWGASWTSTLSENFLLDINYSAWRSDYFFDSSTSSLDDPVLTRIPGNTVYSGGVQNPQDKVTSKNQIKGKATYYAENFLNSEHEFKFGVQYSHGSTLTNFGIGPNGFYTVFYMNGNSERTFQDPFQHGAVNQDLGFFIDDRVTVNQKLILNLGLRFDHNTGRFPQFDILTVGQPSVSSVGNFAKTGQKTSEADVLNWNLVSPRLGVVFQPGDEALSKIQASFGVYYDHDVSGNWDNPSPGITTWTRFELNPDTGKYDIPKGYIGPEDLSLNPNIKPPRTLQYSVGYERQINETMSFGTHYVYKTTKDLIGWEILGGEFEPVSFVDPYTGTEYTLLSITDQPLLQKGNDPGNFPGSENLNYFQKYHGLIFTFDKRFSNKWTLAASYTWSRSTGLLPRMIFQGQNPEFSFLTMQEGRDPNTFINAEGILQGDRPHMFRVMAYFEKLPLGLNASMNVDFSSGKHHVRTAVTGENLLSQGQVEIIMQRGYRISSINMIDLNVGRRFDLGSDFVMRLDATIFNVLNNDNELGVYQTLERPATEFGAFNWTQPRRLQLRVGFEF